MTFFIGQKRSRAVIYGFALREVELMLKLSELLFKKSSLSLWFPLLGAVWLLGSCGQSGSKDEKAPIPRQGQTLTLEDMKKTDFFPSLSSDGLKLLFVSKRDGIDCIYKVDAALGATPEAKVLMSDGIVVEGQRLAESQVWLAPSGVYAIVQVQNSSSNFSKSESSLYTVEFASGVATKIPDSTSSGNFSTLVFSDDSNFFAYTVSELNQDNGQTVGSVYVAAYPNPQPQKIATDDGQAMFFLSNTSYTLVVSTAASTAFQKLSFTNTSPLVFSALTDWMQAPTMKIQKKTTNYWSLAKTHAYFYEDILENRVYQKAGGNASTLEAESTPTYLKSRVRSDLASVDLSSGTWEAGTWTQTGFEIHSVSMSLQEDFGVLVAQKQIQCKDANGTDLERQTAGVLTLVDGTAKKLNLQLPVINTSNQSLTYINELCQAPTGTQMDASIYAAHINSAATAKEYRIVYATRGLKKNSALVLMDKKADGTPTINAVP